MKAIQLFKIDFCYLENNPSAARSEELLGTFVEKDGKTAIGNANIFLNTLELGSVQIHYDGIIYPYIKYKEIKIS